ncbi:MAG: class I SAM-dependent methyltransferase [Desulfobacterales bacterium]|nr:class I SAM-dependent methyltransferase [Pseudomonadota bacterium]MBU4354380.1 class I SAM-dependent methyltransferase [Pseudomonadota bacterium]MCG2771135.1 class I SAM-dependent methyltransferase [Desulfobacterales bacterium]
MVNNPVRVMIQRRIIKWIKGVTRIGSQARILEIGCGRGAGACLIQEEFHPATLHAFDLDQRMIRMAGRYLKAESKDKICLYVGDASTLPYRDGVLDAVFGFGVLHHLPDWRAGVREIARVLKPGGIYFLEEFYPQFYQNFLARRLFLHPEHDRFYSHDLQAALAEAGFEFQGRLEQKMLGILAVAVKQELI